MNEPKKCTRIEYFLFTINTSKLKMIETSDTTLWINNNDEYVANMTKNKQGKNEFYLHK